MVSIRNRDVRWIRYRDGSVRIDPKCQGFNNRANYRTGEPHQHAREKARHIRQSAAR